jgi:hypothetical protein
MNDLERHNCELFVRSLTLLHVDDDGLTDATDFDDVKAIAWICPQIRDITAAGGTPYLLALNRLATLMPGVNHTRVTLPWHVWNGVAKMGRNSTGAATSARHCRVPANRWIPLPTQRNSNAKSVAAQGNSLTVTVNTPLDLECLANAINCKDAGREGVWKSQQPTSRRLLGAAGICRQEN